MCYLARFLTLLNDPVVLKAFWATSFLMHECEHCPVAFCTRSWVFLSDFIAKCILDAWQWATLTVVENRCCHWVLVPPGLPEQITSPNHLQGNVSSRTAIYRHARWSHFLCINELRLNFHQRSHHRVITVNFLLHFCPLVCVLWVVFMMFLQSTTLRNMVNRKKHGHGYPSSFHKSLCLSARVKTSELFERWRNLQVCRWEQSKEETSNFK